jgi:nucleoside phosphorylase
VAAREPTLAWVRTGVGPAAARRALEALPDVRISAALCSGFAGALTSAVAPGTLVIADPLLDAAGRSQPTPLADVLAQTARAAGLTWMRGALVTVARVIDTPAEKHRLHRSLGALAVDMESAVLATALSARGIPAAAARVVLDAAEEEIPTRSAAFWRWPGQIVTGVRIARRLRPCARISARLLEAWLGGGIEPAQGEPAPDAARDREAEQPDRG